LNAKEEKDRHTEGTEGKRGNGEHRGSGEEGEEMAK
jgi:hypothetical protein